MRMLLSLRDYNAIAPWSKVRSGTSHVAGVVRNKSCRMRLRKAG